MMTRALYDEDSHLTAFTATVCACTAAEAGFDVVLDQTAFYPEGGGQPCDLGRLGGVAVTAVRQQDGTVLHTCAAALPVGAQVPGEIDWARRFDLMQQHSGEHIVSGLVHRLYGYENVGFHMGADKITIDLSGELSDVQLAELERLANEAVWADTAVQCSYPGADALQALPYRSKKALTGRVRIVEYPGIDRCACCGTHVQRTGEIGLIRLFSAVKFRDGVRVELLCGGRCFDYLRALWEQNRQISNLLSAKPLETAQAAQRLAAELSETKFCLTQLENQQFAQRAAGLRGAGDVLLQEQGLAPDGVRRLAIAVSAVCGGRAAVFSGSDADGWQYALGWEGGDLRAFSRGMNAALQGRGGGKPHFVQGSVRAPWAAIEAFFQAETQP